MKTVVAAIDFGTSKIVTLLAESGGFNRCDIIGSGTVPYDGYQDGDWNTPEQLSQAIRNSINAAELEAKRRIREIYVGVPCEYINTYIAEAEVPIHSEDGRASHDDVESVQDAVADKLNLRSLPGVVIHRSPAWFSVDGGKKGMSPVGLKGSKLKAAVAFVMADKFFVEDIKRRLAEINVEVLGFLSPSLGIVLQLIPLDDRDRSAIMVDVGYLNTDFSIVEGDAITYHAVLPIGGGHVTADLAIGLNIPMHAAERIKREYIFMPDEFDPQGDHEVWMEDGTRLLFRRDDVQEIVEARVDELAEMIELTIAEAKSRLSPRSQMFLTGGGIAMMRGGREYMAEQVKRSIKAPMAKTAKHNSPVFASTLGLIDLVFDSIEQREGEEESFFGRVADSIRGLVKR